MDKELVELPNWLIYSKSKGTYHVDPTIHPLVCQNPNCGKKWFPEINEDGTVNIPQTCPGCRTRSWRVKRD